MQDMVTGVHSTISTNPIRSSVVENQIMTMITKLGVSDFAEI